MHEHLGAGPKRAGKGGPDRPRHGQVGVIEAVGGPVQRSYHRRGVLPDIVLCVHDMWPRASRDRPDHETPECGRVGQVQVHEVDSLPDEESTQPRKPAQVVVTRDPETVNRHSDQGELRGEMFRRACEHVGDVAVNRSRSPAAVSESNSRSAPPISSPLMRCSTRRRPVAPTESGDGFLTQEDYVMEPVWHDFVEAPMQAPDEVFQPVGAGPHH